MLMKLDLQLFAKLTSSFKSKGQLDLDQELIHELNKDGEIVVSIPLREVLERFDGSMINISITEEILYVPEENELDEDELEEE